jgi:superfamily I DNA/RNA helicase
MVYDVLHLSPDLRKEFDSHSKAEQALKDHEAKHVINMPLWQAVYDWLIRHKARLISDLPAMLVDRLQGGDFPARRYRHVIVDEFQDLTPGEQALFTLLTADNGNFLALGDSRQSIYAFRGNDRQGLNKLDELLLPKGNAVTDLPMAECHRCPAEIVEAANQLMGLYDSRPMVPASKVRANTHLVVWNSPRKEAEGMARAILENLEAFPSEAHLVMVTRRQFGYILREEIAKLNTAVRVDLSFSESLLETWQFGRLSLTSV